jgi:hypothetical protein
MAKRMKPYLVGRYVASHLSPTGRCTRGYVAFDLEDRELVFFKDQWRPGNCKHTELETYQELHKHKVKCIATVLAGGDVIDNETVTVQATISQRYLKMPEKRRPVQRIHTRLVTKEVGRSLDDYDDSVELIFVCTQALIGEFPLAFGYYSLLILLKLTSMRGKRRTYCIAISVWATS